MPSPDALGSSPRYIEVTSFPIVFAEAFAAKYPEDPRFAAQAVSRAIVALGGGGTLTVTDTTNKSVTLTFAAGEVNAVQAIGITAAVGVTGVKVFL